MSKRLSLPDALTWYRLLMFPVVLYFIIKGEEELFTLFFCINLISDIADGIIARAYKLSTEFGARLDSVADLSNYINGIIGIFVFKLDVLQPHLGPFLTFISLFLLSHLTFFIRFGRMPSFHLYSWKVGGYIQGIWLFTFFVFGFWAPYFYFVAVYVTLSCIEHITLQFMFKEPRSNIKGLYWVLKERRKKAETSSRTIS